MMSAFVTEAIGHSITLPVKVLLKATCDQALRSQLMPLFPSVGAAECLSRSEQHSYPSAVGAAANAGLTGSNMGYGAKYANGTDELGPFERVLQIC